MAAKKAKKAKQMVAPVVNGKKVCAVCRKPGLEGKRAAHVKCWKERRREQLRVAAAKHRKLAAAGKTTHYVTHDGKLTKWARENPTEAKKLLKASSHPLAEARLKLLEKVKPS